MPSAAFDIRRATIVFVLLGGLLTVSVLAVEPGLPSKTSILTTSLRAIGAKNPDPDFRNPDSLAIRFLGPAERAILDDFPMDALDLDYQAAIQRLPPGPRIGHDDVHPNELTQLRQGGYSEQERSLYIWEGVTMYLPEAAIKDTLRFIRERSAPNSKVVFDYMLASDPRLNNPTSRFARWGEPWIFGFRGDSAAGSLKEAGLTVVSDLSMLDLAIKYGQPPDGTSTLPPLSDDQRSRKICIAQVPAKR